jgi:hypothetical protein
VAVTIDAPGSDRAALPDTGGRHLGLQGLAGLIAGSAGGLVVLCAHALRRNERAEN